jgi:hypothetical protein
MARLDWQQTWDGVDLEWAATWAEGNAFELGGPPGVTFVASLGIAGAFAWQQARQLAGAAVASAQGEGTLEQTGPMRGDAQAGALASGTLTVGQLLGGAATARAQAAGTLLAVQVLEGDAFASAYGAGDLSLGLPVPAVSIGGGRRRVGRGKAVAGTPRRIGRGTA